MIFMKDFKVMEITEVTGFNYNTQELEFNKVFQYEIDSDDNKYIGKFKKLNDSCEKVKKKKIYSEFMKV